MRTILATRRGSSPPRQGIHTGYDREATSAARPRITAFFDAHLKPPSGSTFARARGDLPPLTLAHGRTTVVNVQNDSFAGGALPVPHAERLVSEHEVGTSNFGEGSFALGYVDRVAREEKIVWVIAGCHDCDRAAGSDVEANIVEHLLDFFGRYIGGSAVALVALLALGIIYQLRGLARDARRFPPPGQRLDVGGYRLHVVCVGDGAPRVVLESAIAASSLSWSRVRREVARFTTACAYDRAGLGWSEQATTPRTLDRVVDDLHAVIANMHCALPCVMVGHSFGAFVCLAYAAQYSQEVGGLVLVDPPSDWVPTSSRQAYLLRGAILMSRLGGVLARVGVVRACLALLTGGAPAMPRHFVKVFGPTTARTLERLVGEVQKLPPEVHPVVQAAWCQPKCFRAMADQLRVFQEATEADAVRRPSVRDIPLAVISGADQPVNVRSSHEALARMSRHGRHFVASKGGHWVPFDEPELVVDAIRYIVETSRRAHPEQRPAS